MNATTKSTSEVSERILLNTAELQNLLGCGRASAVDIGNSAHTRVQRGKRVLWNHKRIVKYIDMVSE